MTKRRSKFASSALACVMVAGLSAYAVPTLNAPETFPIDGDTEGWTQSGDATISEGTLGSRDSLVISFDSAGFMQESIVAPTAAGASGDRFRGDYTPYLADLTYQFKFYADTVQPSGLALYLRGASSGRVWGYNLGLPTVGAWTEYGIAVGDFGSWARVDLSPEDYGQFMTDMADVDWIGIHVVTDPSGYQQIFGLDDGALAVPEPQTICLLLAAMMSLGFTFRSKVGSVMASVRGVIHAA